MSKVYATPMVNVRANLAEGAIQATLFLTTKRPSRTLVDRTYVHVRQEQVPLQPGDTNEALRARVLAAVTALRTDPRLKRRHVDLAGWRRALEHTGLGRPSPCRNRVRSPRNGGIRLRYCPTSACSCPARGCCSRLAGMSPKKSAPIFATSALTTHALSVAPALFKWLSGTMFRGAGPLAQVVRAADS